MCLVIDTCVLAKVFDRSNKEHAHFTPVLEWITVGKGRMIYGGTQYIAELGRTVRFIKIVTELERSGRAIRLGLKDVDTISYEVKRQVKDKKFNDPHLVAIVIVSRCRVVCTDDKEATPYLKLSALYSKYKVKRPKIYGSDRNKNLCCAKHIIAACQ